MGNSHSQSFSRLTPSLPICNGNNQKEHRGRSPLSKFANPENRVLPVALNTTQRLRSTDNGSILQSGGTLSGRKSNAVPIPGSEPEFVQLLQKKAHVTSSSQQNVSFQTLFGHRKSHSDPDIVRMMMNENDNDTDEEDRECRFANEGNLNQRSIIAVSPSKAKIKSRKKKRAPAPPQSNTLPRSLPYAPASYQNENQKMAVHYPANYDYNDAPRRPLPPIPPEEMPPPPPPPPPDYNRSMENIGALKTHNKNYEKNRRTIDKWKFIKNNHDSSIEKSQRPRSKSLDRNEDQRMRESEELRRSERFERNNSFQNFTNRNITNTNKTIPKTDAHPMNALKEAIADAARKRAERLERAKEYRNPSFKSSMKDNYDSDQFRNPISNKIQSNEAKQNSYQNSVQYKPYETSKVINSGQLTHEKRIELESSEQVDVSNFSRKFPIRHKGSENRKDNCSEFRKRMEMRSQGFQSHAHASDNEIMYTKPNVRQSKWDSLIHEPVRRFHHDGTTSTSSVSEEEMEIDLQLRPTLPRRPIELPRFSPTDIWKSINLDFFKSHQQRSDVSSEEGEDVMEEKIHHINRPVAPRRLIHDRSADSGISPDAGSPMLMNENFDSGMLSNNIMCNTPVSNIMPEETWVPQHDLLDDSECGTDESPLDDRNKTPKRSSQAKLSMPNLMFPSRSLPRNEQKSGVSEDAIASDKERTRSRGKRKKSYKNTEGQHFNSLRNLKKALGLRSKPSPIEDNKGLDPNWSLSRSLPNFNNINTDNTGKAENECSEMSIMDHIRRSNSESRAVPQGIYASKGAIGHNDPNVDYRWTNAYLKQQAEGHVIYLPEYSSNTTQCQSRTLTEEAHVNTDSELVLKKPPGRKKFSYQSTVRQEEKKKLEEKLAKEVEARERKRQKEIEWMNKVEEEFRKQRDKEKINIRQQLRILNLQEKSGDVSEKTRKESNKPDGDDFVINSSQNYAYVHKDKTKPQDEGINHSFNTGQDSNHIAFNWKQPTGMKKWLRRQNREYHCLNPSRPEPEGGRSSSDDCKPVDGKREGLERNEIKNPTYLKSDRNKCIHNNDLPCDSCSQKVTAFSNNIRSDILKKTPSLDARPAALASATETKKVERQRSAKEQVHSNPPSGMENGTSGTYLDSNNPHFLREPLQEYELHTRLCRTNSGRTFESHSYYALERRKRDSMEYDDVTKITKPNEPNNKFFSSRNFQKELKENVRKTSRELEKRLKYPACDYESDDSTNEARDSRQPRLLGRSQKMIFSPESREPSFSRNHPLRNGARMKLQMNGYAVSSKGPSYMAKTPIPIQQRMTNGVTG